MVRKARIGIIEPFIENRGKVPQRVIDINNYLSHNGVLYHISVFSEAIQKPFSFEVLSRMIRKVRGKSRAWE